MKTTFEVDDILFTRAKSSLLADEISGDIYKVRRPAGSEKEDVVIVGLGIANDQLQKGVWNINIYVPNLVLEVGSVQDGNIPDTARMQELANIACEAFDDVQENGFYYTVQQQLLVFDPDMGQYFVNIRIEVFNENL